jgi:hypothetical protein
MRLDEFVTRYTDGPLDRVVDATPEELHLGSQLAHLPGATIVRVEEAGELTADDLLVAYVPVEPDGDLRAATEQALSALSPGGRAVLVLASPPSRLPAGAIVDAIASGGYATAGALGLGVGTGLTSISLRRPTDPKDLEQLGSLRSYPDGRVVAGAGAAVWVRLLAERAVEGAVTRTREERLAFLEREVTALTSRLEALTKSGRKSAAPATTGGKPAASKSTVARARSKAGRELRRLKASVSRPDATDDTSD